MEYFEKISGLIGNESSFHFSGAVRHELIAEAELALGIRFSVEYKSFLRECGYIGFGDSILLGLFKEGGNEERGTVLGDTLFAQVEFDLPKGFIVIEYQEYENIYAQKVEILQSVEDAPVYSFDIDSNGHLSAPQRISQSFQSHFEEFVDSLKDG